MNKGKIRNNVINIAVAGSIETDTGQKTSTLVEQVSSIKKMDVIALYNEDIEAAKSILEDAHLIKEFKYINNIGKNRYSKIGKVYTDNLGTFFDIGDIDVVIVTEMNTKIATEVIFNSLNKGRNVINTNAISEATLGCIFKKIANSNNVIYSVGAGDEPAATLDLINFCHKLGLDIICAGKGKNNPLNIYSTPDDFIEKGRQIKVSPQSIASFVDGTKTMLEMAILSNAAGIPIDKTGMHGPKINVSDLVATFNLKEKGGILGSIPAIDYGIGNIAPGVFVVFTSTQKSIISELKYLKLGDGPNFVLFKPYHLGNIESPLSIYDVVSGNKPTLNVKGKFVTMVVGRAKKDLIKGSLLDNVGGYTFSGLAVSCKEVIGKEYVPIGLVENSKVIKDIKKDDIISFENIECNTDGIIYELWDLQKLS